MLERIYLDLRSLLYCRALPSMKRISTLIRFSLFYHIFFLESIAESFLVPIPLDCSFGIPKRGGDWQDHRNRHHVTTTAIKMTIPSAMRLTARVVGRRSKRLNAIQRTLVSTNDDGQKTPLRGDSDAVNVTPSPSKSEKDMLSQKSSSTGIKRKRNEKNRSNKSSVSRRLELESSNFTGQSFTNMVENNELELTTDMVASINPTQEFIDLEVPPEELRPSNTLTTGQCFHWRVVHPTKKTEAEDPSLTSAWGTHDATEWVGILRLSLFDSYESVVLVIRECPDTTQYRLLATTLKRNNKTDETVQAELHHALRDYFQLDVNLLDLYEEWSEACPRLAKIADCIPGVRIIRQDPWECLISFICSSNNNIPRITKMLASIRREYGQPLLQIPVISESNCDHQSQEYLQLYSFPSLEDLASKATDKDLRGKCGMGYRANYVLETMEILRDEPRGGEVYLRNVLRSMNDPKEVQNLLCEFKGVGRKVADCVALFSLDQHSAIPVDTHVWNIAIRDYDPLNELQTTVKSLTPTNYQRVGDLFRSRFIQKAGWA